MIFTTVPKITLSEYVSTKFSSISLSNSSICFLLILCIPSSNSVQLNASSEISIFFKVDLSDLVSVFFVVFLTVILVDVFLAAVFVAVFLATVFFAVFLATVFFAVFLAAVFVAVFLAAVFVAVFLATVFVAVFLAADFFVEEDFFVMASSFLVFGMVL